MERGMQTKFFSEKQRWKLVGNTLQNKDANWTSTDTWDFLTHPGSNDTLFYIENISLQTNQYFHKVLTTTKDNKVNISDYEEITQIADDGLTINVPEQLWMIYDTDIEGYFTLENYKVPKLLTATVDEYCLRIEGNFQLNSIYRIVASTSPSRIEAHAGLFRSLMKGIFDPYVL